jgi:hypothetical protein
VPEVKDLELPDFVPCMMDKEMEQSRQQMMKRLVAWEAE